MKLAFGVWDHFERRPDIPITEQYQQKIDLLREAERLVVHGDITFGEDVRVRGAVELDADEPTRIDAGATLGS